MKRGFTLLELLIVIVIIGVMATLGLTQYGQVVERSRGAEAKQILGQLRSVCASLYLQNSDTADCSATNLGIGVGAGRVPGPAAANCQPSHFFYYTPTSVNPVVTLVANRCQGGAGKQPGGTAAGSVTLTADMATGATTWTSTGGY